MTPENAQDTDSKDLSTLSVLNTVIQIENIKTESNDRVLEIKEFNPTVNKGIYIMGENQHSVSQYVLSVEKGGKVEDIEVFAKCITNNEKAIIEQEAYRRCTEAEIPSLELLCSIPTHLGTFNITRTENYLIPYSRLKIYSIEQYQSMLDNGLLAIDQIHQIGIQHRDTLTRNLAVLSNKTFVSLIFDFETALLSPKGVPLTHKQKTQDRETFFQSLFFQLVKQNPNDKELIRLAEEIKF